MSTNPIRALIVAEAANPEWVSVPLVGWSHYRAIAEHAEVHLVTHVRNSEAVRRAGLTAADFSAIDTERVARLAWKVGSALRGGEGKGWTTMMAFNALSYYYFEHLVWKRFKGDIERRRFDLVHRLTPLSPTIPSLLATKCKRAGVPFVWGPINGGVPWPRQFDSARRAEREWLSYVRGLYKLLPGHSSTRRNSAAIIVGSRDTWRQMSQEHLAKCVYIPENAIAPERFDAFRTRKVRLPIKVVFVGRLVPYKGADMLVEAAAPLIRAGKLTLKIVGDGPQLGLLRALVEREELTGRVDLVGWVDHERVQQYLVEADLLAFPSVREFGGGVALEAMAMGAVPMVVDYGGPAELVSTETGILVEMADRETLIAGFREQLANVVETPASLEAKSALGRARVMQMFTWRAKAAQTLDVYRWVLGVRDTKPDWGMPFRDSETK